MSASGNRRMCRSANLRNMTRGLKDALFAMPMRERHGVCRAFACGRILTHSFYATGAADAIPAPA